MNALIEALLEKIYKRICKKLKIGYTKEVFQDEAQAYLATSGHEYFKIKDIEKYLQPFIKTFNEYNDLGDI
jgi:hypothetical protein